MLTESSNTTVTKDRPTFETERISSTLGSPDIATSTGNVICRSISSGAREGAGVRMMTCTFVTSGTASIGSRWKLYTPAPIKIVTISRTRMRCETAKRMSPLIIKSLLRYTFLSDALIPTRDVRMIETCNAAADDLLFPGSAGRRSPLNSVFGSLASLFLFQFASEKSRFEREAAFGHDAVAHLEPAQHAIVTFRFTTELHVSRFVASSLTLFRDEDNSALADAVYGGARHHQLFARGRARTGLKSDLGEHADPETFAWIGNVNAHSGRARLLIKLRINIGNATCDSI